MIQHVLTKETSGYDWYDMTNPTKADFSPFLTQYGLMESSVAHCLEVGHLPKIEVYPSYEFIIVRAISQQLPDDSDVLTDLTVRISIFYSEHFVITVHRTPIPMLDLVKQTDVRDKKLKTAKNLINYLVSQSLKTFENEVIHGLSEKLDAYEELVFLHRRRKPFMQKLYYLKRQIDLIRIVLTLYKDLVEYVHIPEQANTYNQNLRDLYNRTNSLYRNIAENTAQLLSMYFNIESNHTNEIMRTLTIISVFFMPLTFIVGIYGMNFEYMPELKWPYGYPAIMVFMIVLSTVIYIWFKRKRWL